MFKSLDKSPFVVLIDTRTMTFTPGTNPTIVPPPGKIGRRRRVGKRRFKILNHKLTHL
jgi:hypothetical protein